MSDEPKPAETPPPPPAPAPPKPAAPVIDYALPQRKTFIPSPALIKNVGCLLKLIFGFTVLLCMGYFALVALNPKARQWALQGTKAGPGGTPPSGKGPTPFAFVNQILAIPAQALGKTDEVVKANNARAGQVDTLVAEEEAKAKGKTGRSFAPVTDPFAPAAGDKNKPGAAAATGTAESAESQAVSRSAILALAEKNGATIPVPADAPAPLPEAKASPPKASAAGGDAPEQMKLAGNIIVAHASPAGAPRAAAAFFFWTVNLNVSGITQSKPARMLLNNRLVYEGDVVNRSLGITFAQLDAANQLLVFRDATGAIVTRSY